MGIGLPERGRLQMLARRLWRRLGFEKASRRRLELIAEEMTDVISIIDRDGTLTYVTPSVSKVTGFVAQDVEGTNVLAAIHPGDRERVRSAIEDLAPRPYVREEIGYRLLHRDGEVRHVESVAINLLWRTDVRGIVVVTRDVTERVRLEAAAKRSERLESLGQFAGGLAHEFNNLLAVVRARADLLALDVGPSSREDVEAIQASAERGKELVQQILALSPHRVLQPERVSLADVAGRAVDLVQDRSVPIDIRTELSSKLPVVEVDPVAAGQAIRHLLDNALDAMPDGGTIEMRAFRDHRDDPAAPDPGDGAYVVLEVSDTGTGIEPSVQDQIFDPFFTTKDVGDGRGLGLAMVHEFMRQCGGFVGVTSETGVGTTVQLGFPAATAEPERRGRR